MTFDDWPVEEQAAPQAKTQHVPKILEGGNPLPPPGMSHSVSFRFGAEFLSRPGHGVDNAHRSMIILPPHYGREARFTGG